MLLITLLDHVPLGRLRCNLCCRSHRVPIHSTLALYNQQWISKHQSLLVLWPRLPLQLLSSTSVSHHPGSIVKASLGSLTLNHLASYFHDSAFFFWEIPSAWSSLSTFSTWITLIYPISSYKLHITHSTLNSINHFLGRTRSAKRTSGAHRTRVQASFLTLPKLAKEKNVSTLIDSLLASIKRSWYLPF